MFWAGRGGAVVYIGLWAFFPDPSRLLYDWRAFAAGVLYDCVIKIGQKQQRQASIRPSPLLWIDEGDG
jgi:hypothetical protein